MIYYLLSNNTNLVYIYTLYEVNKLPEAKALGRLLCNNNQSSLETSCKAFFVDLQTADDE